MVAQPKAGQELLLSNRPNPNPIRGLTRPQHPGLDLLVSSLARALVSQPSSRHNSSREPLIGSSWQSDDVEPRGSVWRANSAGRFPLCCRHSCCCFVIIASMLINILTSLLLLLLGHPAAAAGAGEGSASRRASQRTGSATNSSHSSRSSADCVGDLNIFPISPSISLLDNRDSEPSEPGP